MSDLDQGVLPELDADLAGFVERGEAGGLAWAVATADDAHACVAGGLDDDATEPLRRDAIFRISSMSKPVTAVAALMLADDGQLALDDAVDPWLPELADRPVLRAPAGPIDDTVPASRPITVRDLLTFRMGLGMDFTAAAPQPLLAAMGELELGAGAPEPAGPPPPDEWMRRLGTLPLERQPGEQWLYHTSADVLGVLVARVAGQPFDEFLAERLFTPLGMVDTGFSVPAADHSRFTSCYVTEPETGARHRYDGPDGQWSRPPAFPSGGHGLVSTVDDYLAFARMLLAGGVHRGRQLISAAAVTAMTSDQIGTVPGASGVMDRTGAVGWGYGVSVQLEADAIHGVGAYGWDGGLGSSWANEPGVGLIGILLTTQVWNSPEPPPVCAAFWAGARRAARG